MAHFHQGRHAFIYIQVVPKDEHSGNDPDNGDDDDDDERWTLFLS